ncbi:MAG: RNA polymerase sigma factor [Pirellulales bacterium]
MPPDACALAELELLVDGCLSGQPSAVREFVDRFQGAIFGLCYRMLSHRHDAEDMAQETFVRAIRHLHQWDRTRDILPWLLSIAGNRCRTLLSTRKRRPVNGPLVELAADDTEHDDAAKQLDEELRQALAGLRPEYRRAFVLFHEQELGYDEIGRLLDCPLGTVKTWIHRARKEIIQALKDRDVFEVGSHAMRRI